MLRRQLHFSSHAQSNNSQQLQELYVRDHPTPPKPQRSLSLSLSPSLSLSRSLSPLLLPFPLPLPLPPPSALPLPLLTMMKGAKKSARRLISQLVTMRSRKTT